MGGHLEEENSLLKKQVEQLIDDNALLREDNTTESALSVFFSAKAGPGVYLRDDIIIFEEVTARVGEGYNEEVGVFRVPVTGYYLFMVTIQKETENDFYDNSFDINQNGQLMSTMNHYQTPDLEGRMNWSSSMQIILPCEEGDFVWVELTPLNDLGKIRGVGGDQFT